VDPGRAAASWQPHRSPSSRRAAAPLRLGTPTSPHALRLWAPVVPAAGGAATRARQPLMPCRAMHAWALPPQNLLVEEVAPGQALVKIADLGLGRAFSIPVKSYTHEVGGTASRGEQGCGWQPGGAQAGCRWPAAPLLSDAACTPSPLLADCDALVPRPRGAAGRHSLRHAGGHVERGLHLRGARAQGGPAAAPTGSCCPHSRSGGGHATGRAQQLPHAGFGGRGTADAPDGGGSATTF